MVFIWYCKFWVWHWFWFISDNDNIWKNFPLLWNNQMLEINCFLIQFHENFSLKTGIHYSFKIIMKWSLRFQLFLIFLHETFIFWDHWSSLCWWGGSIMMMRKRRKMRKFIKWYLDIIIVMGPVNFSWFL